MKMSHGKRLAMYQVMVIGMAGGLQSVEVVAGRCWHTQSLLKQFESQAGCVWPASSMAGRR
jgi:hypothetical protein